jgi:hypothetical protein
MGSVMVTGLSALQEDRKVGQRAAASRPSPRPYLVAGSSSGLLRSEAGSSFLFGPDLLVEPKLDEMLEPLDVVVPPGVWYD